MKHAHGLTTLNELTLTISKDGSPLASGPVGDFDAVSAAVQIAVEGELPKAVFVYVLQLGPHGQVIVLSHPSEKSPAGVDVRIPAGTDSLTTAIEGEVTVVGADAKVMDSDWASLLGGHDGDTKSGNLKESTVGKPTVPTPPVKPPATPPTSSSGH